MYVHKLLMEEVRLKIFGHSYVCVCVCVYVNTSAVSAANKKVDVLLGLAQELEDGQGGEGGGEHGKLAGSCTASAQKLLAVYQEALHDYQVRA